MKRRFTFILLVNNFIQMLERLENAQKHLSG